MRRDFINLQGDAMKIRFAPALALVALVASGSVLAADAATPAPRAINVAAAATPNVKQDATDTRSSAGAIKVAAPGSQQNRMKECNKQATGKKGAERKAFMKSCLSTKKS
jgi:hypothetical protein